MNKIDNDTFSFDNKSNGQSDNNFVYDEINGLGQSDYVNEDLFNVEISDSDEYDNFETSEKDKDEEVILDSDSNLSSDESNKTGDNDNLNDAFEALPYLEDEETKFDIKPAEQFEKTDENKVINSEENIVNDSISAINNEYLEMSDTFVNSYLDDNYNLPVVEPTVEPVVENKPNEKRKTSLSDTPISELEKLTEYTEEKIQTTDIKSLFDKVGTNVKEASDIFKKNTEMKEKLDSRFEELKKLQLEVERSKKSQYDEINSYKEEVLSKLTEKKEEIEKRLNRLKEFQSNLEKDRLEFEQYKKQEKEEIDRVQKEVQEAYDSRREELSHIEDVLRKQKDALDEERSQLSLDRIQYESDKNELANNLLKFNEIVDTFTNGMDKINKE